MSNMAKLDFRLVPTKGVTTGGLWGRRPRGDVSRRLPECSFQVGALVPAGGGSVTRVPDVEGRRRLDWTLTLDARRQGRHLRSNVFPPLDGATLFNPDWNLVRVVVRGKDAVDELIRSSIRVNPLLIMVR